MIEIKELSKVFHKGQEKVVALQKVSLHISENTFTVIKGPSGSGKSSLLFSIGGMLRPTSGDVFLNGENLYQLTEASRRRKAAIAMGFVFQSYHLLPYLTVTENILLQKRLPFLNIDRTYMNELIKKLRLDHRLNHKPSQLSVGEKQRVAMIRSLASQPKIILADEPIGNLDPENAGIGLSFLDNFRQEGGTCIMVSHSSDADAIASRVIHLREGMILSN